MSHILAIVVATLTGAALVAIWLWAAADVLGRLAALAALGAVAVLSSFGAWTALLVLALGGLALVVAGAKFPGAPRRRPPLPPRRDDP